MGQEIRPLARESLVQLYSNGNDACGRFVRLTSGCGQARCHWAEAQTPLGGMFNEQPSVNCSPRLTSLLRMTVALNGRGQVYV